jgi:hypothetical protein
MPKAGNPSEARWWAAHLIYFQCHTENNETPSPTNPSVSSTTTDYVVYEGEMNHHQHGRGTYYYHIHASPNLGMDPKNGGMYVSDFKENARHGIGTYIHFLVVMCTLATGVKMLPVGKGLLHGRQLYLGMVLSTKVKSKRIVWKVRVL